MLARVDSTRDVWTGEQDYAAIDSELKAIAKALLTQPNSFEPLKEHTGDFRALNLAEFKIVATGRGSVASNVARIAVRVELGGEASDGSLLSKLGAMDMSWAETPTGWSLRDSSCSASSRLPA